MMADQVHESRPIGWVMVDEEFIVPFIGFVDKLHNNQFRFEDVKHLVHIKERVTMSYPLYHIFAIGIGRNN
jgi:hypothetical protein